MYNKKLEQIFTQDRLLDSLENYQKAKDHDAVLSLIKSNKFEKNLIDGFIPDPVVGFSIEKSNHEKRQLALSATSSKVVQKILAQELEHLIKFSDKSYAFRKNKGTLKAIKRTKDYLHKNFWIAKADINDFFDTINQETLIQKLDKLIEDKRVIRLISIFLSNGMLKNKKWVDKQAGIYQGDNLSPLLSNIYLHDFDTFLESKHVSFVRFADDMVFFAKHRNEVIKILDMAEGYLNSISLSFGKDKSYISNKKEGFEYLGLRFRGQSIKMDNSRLMKKISKLSQKTKTKSLERTIEIINEHVDGIRRYYIKILTDKSQFELLEQNIYRILISKIKEAKKSKKINKKSIFKKLLFDLKSYTQETKESKEHIIESLITKAYEMIALEDPLKSAKKEISKNKTDFLKQQIKHSELILSKYGLYAGITKGKVIVKEYGKIVKQLPLNALTRIIIMSPSINLSSMLIYQCSKRKIDIDFIYHNEPYAMITYYKHISYDLHIKQLETKASPKGIAIAKAFIRAKSKNQINLIKYYSRYRENTDNKEFLKLEEKLEKMEILHKKIPKAKTKEQLMGYEGNISMLYWSAFGILIDDESFTRVTYNAPDPINQAINYGYGFLYNRVQSALISTGLNLYHSFLHTEQSNKPTLVYDIIEEFRQPTVDREIISILNRGTKIKSSKGRLTKESIKVITQNIQERLITPTKWRKGKYKITSIIDEQVLSLSHVIIQKDKRYKGFIARF